MGPAAFGMRARCLAGVASGAFALSACGETSMSAGEFVDSMREQGVEIELGRKLISSDPEKEIHSIELEPLPGSPGRGGEDGHTGGSLSVHEDSEGADRGMETCEAAADLLCYRAANIVIVLEEGGIEARRLAAAMRELAEGQLGDP